MKKEYMRRKCAIPPYRKQFSTVCKGAGPTMWTDMETLAKQIEQEMHGEWKHCLVPEKDLKRIWPINGKDREKKIAEFAKKYGFRLRFYGKGMGSIFDKWPPEQRT